jgi:hypothetical protein
MGLVSAEPITEISTRNISWAVKAAIVLGFTTLLPSFADCLEI